MTKLFQPIDIRGISLKNRIIVSPMCQYSAQDGFANDWHLVHLGSRAVGGAALVIFEATAISAEGRITLDDLGIWNNDHILKLRQITEFITSQDCVPGIQLSHAGRKASTHSPWKGHGAISSVEGAWTTFAPSGIPYSESYSTPEALDLIGIKKIVKDFADAAERALVAGFKVIELHAAHGYLLHQFLSPLTNVRDDEYGGNFENRIRLLLEVIVAVRMVWPHTLPLFLRVSATDWAKDGWNLEDTIRLADIVKSQGVDLIDVSTGGLVQEQQIPVAPGYQLKFCSAIKHQTGMITGAVGLITEAVQAETILVNEDADLIVMAREILRNPYFPLRAASILKQELDWPAPYQRAKW